MNVYRFGWFAAVTSVALLGSLALAPNAIAQDDDDADITTDETPYNVNPLEDFQGQNEVDPFTGSNSGFSMFDIIHRANLGLDGEFDRDGHARDLNDAAADFRARQLELLRQSESEGIAVDDSSTGTSE